MVSITIRDIPEELFEKFKEIAKQDRRSVNAEMIEMIDRTVKQNDLRIQRLDALENLTRIRKSQPASVPGVSDGVTLLREDRAR